MKRNLAASLFMLITLTVQAQNSTAVTAGDFLRQSDNLYVVISILVTIFAGIIVFLFLQEKKISKLEKQIKDKLQ